MASDSSDYQLEDELVQELFSKQFIGDMSRKIVGIHDVVQKFIETNTMSDDEKKSLLEKKVADIKFSKLIKVVTRHCENNNIQVLKSFICALEETKNSELAKQLTLVYDERVNSLSILNRLSKEKSLVGNLKNEIKRLQLTLEEREYELQKLKQDKKRLAENLKTTESDQKQAMRLLRKELQGKISKKDEYISAVGKELEDLSQKKDDLEKEVDTKSLVIEKRESELQRKEKELQMTIKESNHMSGEIQRMKENFVVAIGEEKEQLTKEIEKLEDRIAEKESTILNLRRNQTLTRGEIEEELKNIMGGQERKIDEQIATIQNQNENIRQQNEKIDVLTNAVMKLVNHIEKKQ
ncbi:uncharacterized protein [Mytilus edulis]|uniref:uncharacterized protein n=1 Tax=Mytilus edulis TaxID=6550 RepID=UPI0039F0BEBF